MQLFKNGMRWNTDLFKPDRLDVIREVQYSATESYSGRDDIMQYLDMYHPNIGDEVTNLEIREYLDSHAQYYGKDLDSIMLRFGRTAASYGFQYVTVTKRKEDRRSARKYRRVRPVQ